MEEKSADLENPDAIAEYIEGGISYHLEQSMEWIRKYLDSGRIEIVSLDYASYEAKAATDLACELRTLILDLKAAHDKEQES